MISAFIQLKKFIAPFGLSDADFEVLTQGCEVVNFKKNDIIIKAGEKQNCIYFLSKGIIRNFVLTIDGNISTYGFRIENMLITGYGLHNFHNEQRALVSVDCLENCEMIKIPFSALRYMEESSKDAHKVARFIADAHIIDLVNFIISVDTKSIAERYDELELQFPNIHQRVPQHIIAAYLRISRVHLSRVKKLRINR
jgi:CRP-like cAMP-binding protein